MPHPCFGEQAAAAASLEDADGEVDVLAEAHLRESSETFVDVVAHSHVEGTRIKLVELLLSAADATRRKERRHGV